MKSIKVTILDRKFPLQVEEAEEESIRKIARFVDEKFKQYKADLSKQSEATVMGLAALSIAEELFEERKENQSLAQSGQEQVMGEVNQSVEDLLDEIRG